LVNAKDIGKELKLLKPSPLESECISAWESILTPCLVKNLHPGFVVVKLDADSFEDIDPDIEVIDLFMLILYVDNKII
jgi:hypothetical protein